MFCVVTVTFDFWPLKSNQFILDTFVQNLKKVPRGTLATQCSQQKDRQMDGQPAKHNACGYRILRAETIDRWIANSEVLKTDQMKHKMSPNSWSGVIQVFRQDPVLIWKDTIYTLVGHVIKTMLPSTKHLRLSTLFLLNEESRIRTFSVDFSSFLSWRGADMN